MATPAQKTKVVKKLVRRIMPNKPWPPLAMQPKKRK